KSASEPVTQPRTTSTQAVSSRWIRSSREKVRSKVRGSRSKRLDCIAARRGGTGVQNSQGVSMAPGRDLSDLETPAMSRAWAGPSNRQAPPVVNGTVRIVELEGFEAQACGGTHVHSTEEIGEARIVKFDNRGENNKRFYWELAPSSA